jgi:hypothetical protein
VDKKKLISLLEMANDELKNMPITTLDQVNDIAYATARVISSELGFKLEHRPRNEPPWKIRIQRKIEKLRRDLSQIEKWREGSLKNELVKERLRNVYWIEAKGLQTVSEELKQRITAQAVKLQRYQQRINQFRENRDFLTNQKRLFSKFQGETQTEPPNAHESVTFWESLWAKPIQHKQDAEWINTMKQINKDINDQSPMEITQEKVAQETRRMKNWKAPGPDQLHGFWLKKLTSLHPHLARLYQRALKDGCPEWMTSGRTTLLQKDKEKGTAVENYRPITCLPQCGSSSLE